jgi:peroxiredoxin
MGDCYIKNSSGKKVSFLKSVPLPSFELTTYKGDRVMNKDLDAKLNILIFFTLDDCPACLFEAEFWSKAYQKFSGKDVRFIGVTPEKDGNKILRFCKEYNISFPILYDENGKLMDKVASSLSYLQHKPVTPFKIFVIEQKIISYEGPTKDPVQQRKFGDRIYRLLILLR